MHIRLRNVIIFYRPTILLDLLKNSEIAELMKGNPRLDLDNFKTKKKYFKIIINFQT